MTTISVSVCPRYRGPKNQLDEYRRDLIQKRAIVESKLRSLYEQEYLYKVELRRLEYQLTGSGWRPSGAA